VTPTIKAIETLYNGHRFRSRLEARWAVFMDCLGIKYQYEPEGYTDGKTKYLCDFYLPKVLVADGIWNFGCWLEIKPTPAFVDNFAVKKAVMVATGTNQPVHIFAGGIDCKQGITISKSAIDPDGARFGCCMFCRATNLNDFGDVYCDCRDSDSVEHADTVMVSAARAVAKQIRFEHPYFSDLKAEVVRRAWFNVWTMALNDLGEKGMFPCGGKAKEEIGNLEEYGPRLYFGD
jgi:hypothetical protein